MSGKLSNVVLIVVSAVIIPLFFPASEYGSGLTFFQTFILLGRDLMLIIAWGGLMKEVWNYGMVTGREPTSGENTKAEVAEGT
jgi:hypothetical protein